MTSRSELRRSGRALHVEDVAGVLLAGCLRWRGQSIRTSRAVPMLHRMWPQLRELVEGLLPQAGTWIATSPCLSWMPALHDPAYLVAVAELLRTTTLLERACLKLLAHRVLYYQSAANEPLNHLCLILCCSNKFYRMYRFSFRAALRLLQVKLSSSRLCLGPQAREVADFLGDPLSVVWRIGKRIAH